MDTSELKRILDDMCDLIANLAYKHEYENNIKIDVARLRHRIDILDNE